MWAQRLVAPCRFAEVEVPRPLAGDLADGEVLLRVLAGGICGSDLPAFRGAPSPHLRVTTPDGPGPAGFPMHEVLGEVLASTDPDLAVGQRVVGWASRFDAIAGYTITLGADVAPYDPALAPEDAIMLQPLACVLYAVDQLVPVLGCRVAVLGLGPIGLLFTHVLAEYGASHVTGVDTVDRRDVADRFGIDDAVHADTGRWVEHLAEADRADVVVEAIGHNVATLGHAIGAARPGGRIHYFGVPDDPVYPFALREFFRRNLTLVSGITRDRRRMLGEAGRYLRAHPDLPAAYVTHVLDAHDAQRAFELAARPAPGRLKVVLRHGS
ncbi:zinc-binding dehydrogenase [Pseudonocardia sp. KRD-291]|nr:zinc-binding dehydrogenase [Pseudonocardia sp. KRD291]